MSHHGRCYLRVSKCGTQGALVAVACGTDFVASREEFGSFLGDLADHVLKNSPKITEEALDQEWAGGGTVRDAMTKLSERLGETLSLEGVKFIVAEGGFVGGYIHHNNRVGVLAAIQTNSDREPADAVLRNLGMHATAMAPLALSREVISATLIKLETERCRRGVNSEPEAIQEKLIGEQMERYFGHVVLREQPWVMDDSRTVEQAVADALGKDSIITDYARFQIDD